MNRAAVIIRSHFGMRHAQVVLGPEGVKGRDAAKLADGVIEQLAAAGVSSEGDGWSKALTEAFEQAGFLVPTEQGLTGNCYDDF